MFFFFFFKQKTAYEWRISDWSSDVCSSDLVPLLEKASGKLAGVDFGIAVNPEFLRESTAIYDYNHPPMTVIGEWDKASGDLLASLYQHLPAPVIRKSIEEIGRAHV